MVTKREERRHAGIATMALGGIGLSGIAVAGGACCAPVIAPLVVSILGAGGAVWAAQLGPWSGWILGGAGALIALAHWRLHGTGCTTGAGRGSRWAMMTVWAATLAWVLALLVRLWADTVGFAG